MIFWDTSAIIPLLVDEPRSERGREVLESDRRMIVWWGTTVECWSAIARLRREEYMSTVDEEHAGIVLERLRASWVEIEPSEEVRAHAGRLLRTHPLRASDALQLGAALVWSGSPAEGALATYDVRLADAARVEGFDLPLA